jgi:hypothetical protein
MVALTDVTTNMKEKAELKSVGAIANVERK